jgi:hypothetical protein
MAHPSNSDTGETAATGNLKHSRELAQQLVRHLGIEGATRACLENHWQGVLEVVQSLSPKH